MSGEFVFFVEESLERGHNSLHEIETNEYPNC